MKRSIVFITAAVISLMTFAHAPLNPAEVKWEPVYQFDRRNVFKIEFYAKDAELMRTLNIRTYYQSQGDNFLVRMISDRKGYDSETIIDKKNELAVQIFGMGEGIAPMYNAGGYRYPSPEDLKQLQLVPTEETKLILGFTCKKYTYTHKKIFGEVWLTDQVPLPNDIGAFRACKMAALHNTLSAPGFVMEMTTEDEKGGRTLMTTVSLQNDEKYIVDLKGVEMTVAVNTINYFTF